MEGKGKFLHGTLEVTIFRATMNKTPSSFMVNQFSFSPFTLLSKVGMFVNLFCIISWRFAVLSEIFEWHYSVLAFGCDK